MPFEKELGELADHTRAALAMGGEDKLARRRAEGVLDARERLDRLLDAGSFVEWGMFARGILPEVRDRSPADGKVAGFGRIEGRPVGVVSNDFTVLGASSSVVNGKKIRHVRETVDRRGMPLVLLGESSGARMPDRMGAPGRAILGQDPLEFRRLRSSPWVSALLGSCYGSSTWYGCMSDFVVMRKGATMAVASSRVTSMAIGQEVDPEELGGWELHTGTTGLVDVAVDTDEEALDTVRRVLSYLPSSAAETPPVATVPAGSDEASQSILDVFPESRSSVYDVRTVIGRIADRDSLFELKPRFGKSLVTAFVRMDGHSVGVVANNPKFKGGAIDVDSMHKATSFLVLCDSFNIPLVFLVDQPGFLIGVEGEKRGAPGRIMNWMNALAQVTVPKLSIVMRKSYGQAYLNMGGGRYSDALACWPMADLGFMDPSLAVNVLHGVKQSEEPERFEALRSDVARDTSAWALAALYEAHAVLDPRDTRRWLKEMLALHRRGKTVSEHRLANWPTSY
ncbi:MAG TPA: carboxyl transferase domain-containing protein [Ramlibacter sp.]|uniref:acyl-CoA carboxylase subunit beta n=1 Tax=Ramlibacter sp. TaxID=1917967 RepID=UPI002B749A2A|nr:carboxyl transferase domain-containing protein [Ramlibacter sp.]HVZ46821.1 carboxyl transferase domain-containing protein [Ramlibacter sp.]